MGKSIIRVQLLLILICALALRIYHHHHLMSDEAQNMLTIKALIEGDGFRDYFFKHPPLFMVLSAIISYPFGDNLRIVQGISIMFSILSFIPAYFIAEKLFDKKTALLSLLLIALMPLNVSYSTWVKQDAMLLFFFALSLYYYMAGRLFLSGILFGTASLTKEFAWFLVPIVFGWEIISGWKGRDSITRLFIWLLTGTVLSAWWYLLYGGMSVSAIRDAIVGGNLFEYAWHHPWYYYFQNMRWELTLPLVPLLIIGIFCLGRGARLLPLLWVSSLYIPLSLMTVKASWYTYLASPALSMAASMGLLKTWSLMSSKVLRVGLLGFVVAAMLVEALSMTVNKGYEKEYMGPGREMLRGENKVAMIDYNPSLQYYLGISDKRLVYLGLNLMTIGKDGFRRLAREDGIGWFVIDLNSAHYLDKNLDDMAFLWGRPEKIGNVLIFRAVALNF